MGLHHVSPWVSLPDGLHPPALCGPVDMAFPPSTSSRFPQRDTCPLSSVPEVDQGQDSICKRGA